MNRLWTESRENYSRSCLPGYPAGCLLSGGYPSFYKKWHHTSKRPHLVWDGTPVAGHANPYGKKPVLSAKSTCSEESEHGLRRYSDPDAEWGWDSHEKRWHFGHTLYMFSFRNTDLKVELPILINFTSAKRHDSINFLYAIDALGTHEFGISPTNLCLDSAHDDLPTYRLLDHWDVNALIDINSRNSSADGLPEDITLDKEGPPLFRADFRNRQIRIATLHLFRLQVRTLTCAGYLFKHKAL